MAVLAGTSGSVYDLRIGDPGAGHGGNGRAGRRPRRSRGLPG